jgi:phosphoribosylformylglycinamidine synthase
VDAGVVLMRMLASRAMVSRHGVFAHFDSDVQGRTLLRPGDGDAGVVVPWRDAPLGVAVGLGGDSRWGRRDAWRAGAAAVCEAVRNVVAVGATPWALTDCINHGSPESAHAMQDLADVVAGLGDAARALGVRGHEGAPLPFVSGNVSLYNQGCSGTDIPASPIVACFGVLCDASTTRGLRFKVPGEIVYRLGEPSPHLVASLYAHLLDDAWWMQHGPLPPLDFDLERRLASAVLDAFAARIVAAAHDLGDGGLAAALVEMCLGRDAIPVLGVDCALEGDIASEAILFGEASGYICSVAPDGAAQFESLCRAHAVAVQRIGTVTTAPRIEIRLQGEPVIRLDLEAVAASWKRGLDDLAHGGGGT